MKSCDIAKLAFCLLTCFSAAFFGSLFVTDIHGWYENLVKPFFTPPDWIFGPVWTILYSLMGISLFLIVKQDFKNHFIKIAVAVFAAQLLLNTLWTPIFFGFKLPFWALLEILVLWTLILVTILIFRKVSAAAALLLVPYLIWTTYAAFLNAAIVILN